ncbi:MAG: Tetratricopeptide repeat [Acidobacteriota bacterium]|nr:Tetratricopeptide repeat [Acidobacteriota bacterium]
MVVKPCPSCGAMPVPEARFCRVCGAPLKAAGMHDNDAPISPLAQTVPLTGEGRATDGLAQDDPSHSAPETSRVGRAEIEDILRRVQAEYGNDGQKDAPQEDSVEVAAPQTTTLASEGIAKAQPGNSQAAASTPSPAQVAQPAPNVRARRMWQVAAAVLLCVALLAAVLAFVLSRRASSTDAGNAPPISINDQKQLVGEKLAEAETLLNAGEFNRAVEVLRAAVKLDPSNAEARMRLGNALERTGSRSEAIEEYRAAAQSSPNDVTAWRALASAQVEEKLYNDAAESYRRLLAASGNSLDDETWLAYAEALRLAGRTEEARAAYQKISSAASATVAQTARRHLAELGPPAVAVNTEHARDAARPEQEERKPDAATAPTTTSTPLARATPQMPAVANNASNPDYDSYYFQALNVVNGRDPKKIERADLLRALALFQRAALGGTHRTDAQKYVDRLGKEYDRRRNKG